MQTEIKVITNSDGVNVFITGDVLVCSFLARFMNEYYGDN